MTVVTDGEILSPRNGRVPKLDSPAAPASAGARARQRIPVTLRVRNWRVAAAAGARSWWVWTARPASLAAAWRLSAVDPRRIPAGFGPLRALWAVLNWSDRLVWFALMFVAPSGLQGPLRWLAVRPTRRWGFVLVAALLGVAWLLGRE